MILLWLCIAWVFASVAVACLPMRRQYAPGLALLIAAPVLIGAIAWSAGWMMGFLALAAFLSMYRNPLRFLLARVRGQNPELPQ